MSCKIFLWLNSVNYRYFRSLSYSSSYAKKFLVHLPLKEPKQNFEPSVAAEIFYKKVEKVSSEETAVDFHKIEKLIKQVDIIEEKKKLERKVFNAPKKLARSPTKICLYISAYLNIN